MGKQLAAWLGLVPKRQFSGGKTRLLGISKHGDTYLRALLIHGERSMAYLASRKTDQYSLWIADKPRRIGT